MKKLLALLIALVMVFGAVAACGGGDDPTPTPTPTPTPASDPDPTPAPAADPDPTPAPADDDPPPPPPEAPQAPRPISADLVYWAGDGDFAGYEDPDNLPGATVIGDGDTISENGSGFTMLAGGPLVYTRSNGPGVTVASRENPWDSLDVGFTDLPTGDYLFMAKVSANSEIDFWLQLEADNWQNSSGEGGCFGITRLNGVSSGTLTTFISVKNIADYETTVDQNRVRINATEIENYNIEAIAIYKAEPGQIYDGSFDMAYFGDGMDETVANMPGSDWPAWENNVYSNGAGRLIRGGGTFVAYTDEGYLEVDERPWPWDAVDFLIGGLEDGEYTVKVSLLSDKEHDFQIKYEDLSDDDPNKHLDAATGTDVTLTGTFTTQAPWDGFENGNRIRINTPNAEDSFFITSIKLFKNF